VESLAASGGGEDGEAHRRRENRGKMENDPLRRSRWLPVALIVAWAAALALPPVLLARWRAERLVRLSDPAVQAEWTEFREAMKKQTDRSGPVQRKVPKSAEPPELVWLRDHFWLAVAAWVVLGGVLGAFLALAVLGVARGPRPATGPGSVAPSARRRGTTPT
jgi:hypothetical protein